MRRYYFIVCILLIAMLSGCLVSLNPLYTPEVIIKMPGIVGEWYDEDNNTWTFIDTADFYQLIYYQYHLNDLNLNNDSTNIIDSSLIEHGDSCFFDVHFVKLDKYIFIDMFPTERSKVKNSLYLNHLIYGHSFWKYVDEDSILKIADIKYDWFKEKIDESDLNTPNISMGQTKITFTDSSKDNIDLHYTYPENGNIVLTGTTQELQKFVKKIADSTDAFNDPVVLRRKK